MAGFNWFERRFESPNQPAEGSAPPADRGTPSPQSDQAVVAPALSSEDYLNWAKAAYQNLQKQQAETAPEPAEETATTPEKLVVPDKPTTGAPSPTAAVSTPATPIPAPAEPATPAPKPEPTVDMPAAQPPATNLSSPPGPSLPVWARAEAERQQRLARLEEMAISEPEPATPAAVTPAPTLLPDINLDEAFLWSAEVLSAQGRRPDDISVEEITWLKRLRQGLNKTRLGLINQLKAIVGQGPLNEEAVMEIEALLLQADVGVAATDKVIEALQTRLRQEVLPPRSGHRLPEINSAGHAGCPPGPGP